MADRTSVPRRLAAGRAAAAAVAAVTGVGLSSRPTPARNPDPARPAEAPARGAVGGVPMYAGWPAAAPDLALVVTGQTYGYLSPCGCSRPQKGGLERRANLINGLKAKGWTVVGLDLGDAAAQKGLPRQVKLKYKSAMKALAALGYAAVGLGREEFRADLMALLAEYALQNPGQPPVVVAANAAGVADAGPDGQPTHLIPRADMFTAGPGARPTVDAVEVVAPAGKPAVAVVGVIGRDVAMDARKSAPQYGFADNGPVIRDALARADRHPARPAVRVLLYAGRHELAAEAAKAFPQFQLVVCQSEESEPPQFPTTLNDGKTMLIQVGHKGQNVGVVGVFAAPDGGFQLKYQLVPVGEEFATPKGDPAAEAANPVLPVLDEYAAEVRRLDLLADARAKPLPHAAQVRHPDAKLTYVGAETCGKCHPAEYAVWKGSKHSHAYEALEHAYERPGLRQYDPECVVCHTTGFEYAGGFDDEARSAHLKGNQCENCHGPGSGHAARPFDKALYPDLAAWKAAPADEMPPADKLKRLADLRHKPFERRQEEGKVLTPAEVRHVNAVSTMCMRCHDGENDPHFDIYEYFPKIAHSNLRNAGLPPGAR